MTESVLTSNDISTDIKRKSDVRLAWDDIRAGFALWRIWLMISWQDIRLRYRRSALGPLWITLSMAITIYSMGFLYGHLFHMDLKTYYPFLAGGMLTWNLISMLITDSTNAFIEAETYLKQIKLPYTIFILRCVCRSFIIFAHNIVVIIPILLIFHIKMLMLFLIIPALFILAINGASFGMILALFGARYRDVAQIITSLLQVSFFLTPVIWMRNVLPPKYQFIAEYNPFTHYLEIIRAPLLGMIPTFSDYAFVLILTSIFLVSAFFIFARVRARVIYWL